MSSAAWDGTTSKEGVIVGRVRFGQGSGVTIPSGTTNSAYAGFVLEIKDDAGNFVTGIGAEDGAGTQTVYKKWSNRASITGSQYHPALGDICVATSSSVTILKRQL